MFINGDITNQPISEVISYTLIHLPQIVRWVREEIKKGLVGYQRTLNTENFGFKFMWTEISYIFSFRERRRGHITENVCCTPAYPPSASLRRTWIRL